MESCQSNWICIENYSPVLPPDRAPSRGEGSMENCMRMLAFNQSLKFSSGPAQDGSRIGPWEYMAPSYNSDREKLLTSTVCKQCNRENVLTPIKAVKRAIEACKICGNTTQPTKRTVLSNTKGKTKLGDDFQAYCAIDVEETERQIVCSYNACNCSFRKIKFKLQAVTA